MNGDLFYYLGVALAVLAVAVSFLGLRAHDFPGARAAMLGTLAVFLVLVIGTTTYAVVLARHEQEHRRAEIAHEAGAEAEHAGAEEIAAQETGGEGPDTASGADEEEAAAAEAGAQEAVTVEMLEYAFEPPEVTATEGETVTAQNSGAIVHNLTLLDGDEQLAATPDVDPGKSAELTVEVGPGDYEMVCTIPGHAELGMEGTFTVE